MHLRMDHVERMENTNLFLVVGGNGKTGRRVAERLSSHGARVRIGSRRGSPPFSWEEPATWSSVLAGVGAIYLTYPPDLALPGAPAKLAAFAKAAKAAGAQHIVLLSGRGEPQAVVSEEAVRAEGVALTVLRASWFAQNFDEGHLLDSVRAGVIALPASDVAEPFVDVEDIADVAVAALLGSGHRGKVYELTGPRLMTFHEVAAELTAAAGRPIAYVPTTAREFADALGAMMPPEEATFFGELFPYLLDGHNQSLTSTVEVLLGRKARDFRDYAKGAAERGVWS